MPWRRPTWDRLRLAAQLWCVPDEENRLLVVAILEGVLIDVQWVARRGET
jgi:hypothetical protein